MTLSIKVHVIVQPAEIWYSGQSGGLGTVRSRVQAPVTTAICKFTVVRVCFVDGRIAVACVLKHTACAVPDRWACTVSCVAENRGRPKRFTMNEFDAGLAGGRDDNDP